MIKRGLGLFLLAVLWPAAATAFSDLSAGPLTWRLGGYFKSFAAMTQGAGAYEAAGLTERETFWNDASRFRARSSLFLGETLELGVNYELFGLVGDDQRLRRRGEEKYGGNPFGEQILAQLFPAVTTPELLGLEHSIDETDDYRLSHRLDRLYLKLHAGPWDFTLGRAALTWGPGRIWNPTDYLASFSPTEIDKEEKIGVDLAHARVAVTDAVTVEAFAAPVRQGDDRVDGKHSAAAGRVAWRLLAAEWAFSGGWLYDRAKAGFEVDGQLFDAGWRGAITRTTVEGVPGKVYYQAIANADYAWGVAWNPYLAGEYFYNGFGKDDPDEYGDLAAEPAFYRAAARGELYNVGRHYLGVIFSLQPHALVTIGNTAIVNLTDGSVYEGPVVTWSVLRDLDWLFGAQLTFGRVPSEYGGQKNPFGGAELTVPESYYSYLKYYF